MKIFSKLFVLVSVAFSPLLGQQPSEINLVFEPTEITSADLIEDRTVGASMNYPIVFEKEKKYHSFKITQDDFIRKHYENYKVLSNSLGINRSGRFIQGFTLENIDDSQDIVHIYFDVDAVCRRYKKLDDKKLAARVKRLLESGATGKTKKIKLN